MSDTVKIKIRVCTDKVGSSCYQELEYDKEEWEEMDDFDKEDELYETAQQMFSWDWEMVND